MRSLDELPAADAVVLDLAPAAVAEIAGERLPARVARAYRRYRHGPGAFKVDLAVEGGVPWADRGLAAGPAPCTRSAPSRRSSPPSATSTAAACRSGPSSSSASSTWPTRRARAATSTRSGPTPTSPTATPGDATEAILDQIERFAPGLRERIVATATSARPAELEAYNANYVGGDIVTGANTPLQTLFRPRLPLDPYATGIPGVYICSAATPARRGRPRDVRLQRRRIGPAPALKPTMGAGDPSGACLLRVGRRQFQPLAGGGDGGDRGAAGFGDRAVGVVGAAADLELDQRRAAQFRARLRCGLSLGRRLERRLGGALTPADQAEVAVCRAAPRYRAAAPARRRCG